MDIYLNFGMIAAEEAVNDSKLNLKNMIYQELELYGDQGWRYRNIPK
ncbi:MAG: hypothetical protein Ct9H90mP3_0590 [Flammeovirgaceae bacterium]|nr:MAG: hypothetical protein Ct9H90mP3_0590 [Flammeovirgaceae bacterium]